MDEVPHTELSLQTSYTHIGTLVHNVLLYALCVRCYHILKKQICLYHHLTYWSIHCYCTLSCQCIFTNPSTCSRRLGGFQMTGMINTLLDESLTLKNTLFYLTLLLGAIVLIGMKYEL